MHSRDPIETVVGRPWPTVRGNRAPPSSWPEKLEGPSGKDNTQSQELFHKEAERFTAFMRAQVHILHVHACIKQKVGPVCPAYPLVWDGASTFQREHIIIANQCGATARDQNVAPSDSSLDVPAA